MAKKNEQRQDLSKSKAAAAASSKQLTEKLISKDESKARSKRKKKRNYFGRKPATNFGGDDVADNSKDSNHSVEQQQQQQQQQLQLQDQQIQHEQVYTLEIEDNNVSQNAANQQILLLNNDAIPSSAKSKNIALEGVLLENVLNISGNPQVLSFVLMGDEREVGSFIEVLKQKDEGVKATKRVDSTAVSLGKKLYVKTLLYKLSANNLSNVTILKYIRSNKQVRGVKKAEKQNQQIDSNTNGRIEEEEVEQDAHQSAESDGQIKQRIQKKLNNTNSLNQSSTTTTTTTQTDLKQEVMNIFQEKIIVFGYGWNQLRECIKTLADDQRKMALNLISTENDRSIIMSYFDISGMFEEKYYKEEAKKQEGGSVHSLIQSQQQQQSSLGQVPDRRGFLKLSPSESKVKRKIFESEKNYSDEDEECDQAGRQKLLVASNSNNDSKSNGCDNNNNNSNREERKVIATSSQKNEQQEMVVVMNQRNEQTVIQRQQQQSQQQQTPTTVTKEGRKVSSSDMGGGNNSSSNFSNSSTSKKSSGINDISYLNRPVSFPGRGSEAHEKHIDNQQKAQGARQSDTEMKQK